ncbi:electron transporter SenC [Thiomicrospira aerophila AL3]|uniref:Electron transporter SenC n=1 Tax=Thiomicrospira aerophila AL3 TaxID=717772 RepID=W0DQT5_9GAMM|nr:SCO family protein [Thiomicrospira aerophila]AHF00985.1 electron transporter SenC [Thiomicrospira aerophila AL3]
MQQRNLNKAFLLLMLAFGVFLAGSYALLYTLEPKSTHPSAQSVSMTAPPGGDFTLQSDEGSVSLSDFNGQVVLAYFGYTFCPDICPTNLGELSLAYRQLTPEQQQQVQILFISVDPERDTPTRLRQYVDYFAADMLGLTADASTIAEVAQRYGAVYLKIDDGSENYAVDHSAFTYVIDRNGQLQTQLPHAAGTEFYYQTLLQYLERI